MSAPTKAVTTHADLAAAARRAGEVADDVLFPAAQATDRARLVPLANIDASVMRGCSGCRVQ